MKRLLIATCLLGVPASASAQPSPSLFDPAPIRISEDEATKAANTAAKLLVEKEMFAPWVLAGATAKVWRKSRGDGYVICAVEGTKPGEKPNSEPIVAAIVLYEGPFAGVDRAQIFDQRYYDLYGCNTPNATTGRLD